MSVTVRPCLADWDWFPDAVKKGVPLDELLEDDRLSWEDLDWDTDAARMEFLETFDTWRKHWKSAGCAAFAEVFDSLFWSLRENRGLAIRDLTIPERPDYVALESIWSPATVLRFAKRWKSIDLDECAEFYKPAPDDEGGFETFEDFQSYAEEWGGILERGAEEKKGLVTIVC